MTAPLVLVPGDEGGLQLGRLLGGRHGQPVRVELRGPAGTRTIRMERKELAWTLAAHCQSLDEADALVHAARARLDPAEIEAVWALLEGQASGLGEIAQLLMGTQDTSARDAAALVLGLDDDAFALRQGSLVRRSATERANVRAARVAEAHLREEIGPWIEHIDALRAGQRVPRDRMTAWLERLEAWARAPGTVDAAVERLLALRGRRKQATVRDATDLLCEVGAWDGHEDVELMRTGLLAPWPREVLASIPAHPALPAATPRLDLPFVTIDNDDPHEVDDALHIARDGDKIVLWLAIASPASFVALGGPLDRAALERGATLYHPRYVAGMLPDEIAREKASLRVGEWRPALVFRLELDAEGRLVGESVVEAEVRAAHAWSYRRVDAALAGESVDPDLDLDRLRLLVAVCLASETQRIAAGAYLLYKPDVEVRAPPHGAVELRPASQTSTGRRLVTEAMVLCGTAAGRIATRARLPLPFRSQPRPQGCALPPGIYTTPAEVFSVFRSLAPARTTATAEPHGVMGVAAYAQVTSPLRRYGDLIAHRQLIAWLRGEPLPYTAASLAEASTRAETAGQERRQWQRRGERYFKLVWLASRGIGARLTAQIVRSLPGHAQLLAFVPALGLEVTVHAPHRAVGDWLDLVVRSVHPASGELTVGPVD